jgi:hypothetical protein
MLFLLHIQKYDIMIDDESKLVDGFVLIPRNSDSNSVNLSVISKESGIANYSGDFLSDFIDVNDLKEDVVDTLNLVLNSTLLNDVIVCKLLGLYVEKEVSFFFSGNEFDVNELKKSANEANSIATASLLKIVYWVIGYLDR